ncbi:uncharacterized protein LOC5522326 [Nematostella vectensis]|uniref:uncharacterized protein LOC5522326 n=1 Tax=Nematostella vectensis TaxID=45351 RepID=UPI0020775B50|nr:uncharacterized protein LOC5522326 [Nematostella vectensis]XP_048578699.1 uncharacterized protein LOC5522326 [Nematostella vectensis]
MIDAIKRKTSTTIELFPNRKISTTVSFTLEGMEVQGSGFANKGFEGGDGVETTNNRTLASKNGKPAMGDQGLSGIPEVETSVCNAKKTPILGILKNNDLPGITEESAGRGKNDLNQNRKASMSGKADNSRKTSSGGPVGNENTVDKGKTKIKSKQQGWFVNSTDDSTGGIIVKDSTPRKASIPGKQKSAGDEVSTNVRNISVNGSNRSTANEKTSNGTSNTNSGSLSEKIEDSKTKKGDISQICSSGKTSKDDGKKSSTSSSGSGNIVKAKGRVRKTGFSNLMNTGLPQH